MSRLSEWDARVICAVVCQALRLAERGGLISADRPGPEFDLLGGILMEHAPEVTLLVPPESEVAAVRGALGPGQEDRVADTEARRSVARVKGATAGLLPVSLMNRTALILAREFPPEPLIPLGDVPASVVLATSGGCSLPSPFTVPAGANAAATAAWIEALEGAVDRWARGMAAGRAAADPAIPAGVRSELIHRLETGPERRGMRGVVPKLGNRTPGIDLDL